MMMMMSHRDSQTLWPADPHLGELEVSLVPDDLGPVPVDVVTGEGDEELGKKEGARPAIPFFLTIYYVKLLTLFQILMGSPTWSVLLGGKTVMAGRMLPLLVEYTMWSQRASNAFFRS